MHYDLDMTFVYIWPHKNRKITSICVVYSIIFVYIDKNTTYLPFLSNFDVLEKRYKITIKVLFWQEFFWYKQNSKRWLKTQSITSIVVYITLCICERFLTNYIITEKRYIDMQKNTTKNTFGVLHDFFDYSSYLASL